MKHTIEEIKKMLTEIGPSYARADLSKEMGIIIVTFYQIISDLMQEVERLSEALDFYSNGLNYEAIVDPSSSSPMWKDRGLRAKKVLETQRR